MDAEDAKQELLRSASLPSECDKAEVEESKPAAETVPGDPAEVAVRDAAEPTT